MKRTDSQLIGDAKCRLAALVDMMDHDIDGDPAQKFSPDGLIGLCLILKESVADLNALDEPEDPAGGGAQ